MPYLVPNLSTLISQSYDDITTANLGGDGNAPLQISIMRYLAYAIANQSKAQMDYQTYISLQSVPFTATGEYLDAWANFKGIVRNPATNASGEVSFSSTSNILIPAQTLISDANGNQYQTQAAYTTNVSSPVAIIAVLAGSQANNPINSALNLVTPISGVNNACIATSAIIGGNEIETDDSLRVRMLSAFQNPPAGGAAADYINWALAVPGVTRAWVNPATPPSAEVVIYCMLDVQNAAYSGFPQGSNGGATGDSRTAPTATGDQLDIANYIFTRRPVTAIPYVAAPILQPINLTIQGLNPLTSLVQSNIVASLTQYFLTYGTPLGGILYLSDLNAAISAAAGVVNFDLVLSSDITTNLGYLPQLGTITYI